MNKIILTAVLAAALFAGCQGKGVDEIGGTAAQAAVSVGQDVNEMASAAAGTTAQDSEVPDLDRTDIGSGFTLIEYEEEGVRFQVLEHEAVRLSRKEGEDRIQVEYGEKNFWVDCPFDFGTTDQPARVWMGDLTGRGGVEISLVGVVAEGTGVHVEDICLIDLKAGRAIAVEPLVGERFTCPFLEERVAARMVSLEDGILEMELDVEEETYRARVESFYYQSAQEASGEHWSRLCYGTWLTYDWKEGGALTATVSAEAGANGMPGFGTYLGDFVVTYRLDGEMMIPEDEIAWKPEMDGEEQTE